MKKLIIIISIIIISGNLFSQNDTVNLKKITNIINDIGFYKERQVFNEILSISTLSIGSTTCGVLYLLNNIENDIFKIKNKNSMKIAIYTIAGTSIITSIILYISSLIDKKLSAKLLNNIIYNNGKLTIKL